MVVGIFGWLLEKKERGRGGKKGKKEEGKNRKERAVLGTLKKFVLAHT